MMPVRAVKSFSLRKPDGTIISIAGGTTELVDDDTALYLISHDLATNAVRTITENGYYPVTEYSAISVNVGGK